MFKIRDGIFNPFPNELVELGLFDLKLVKWVELVESPSMFGFNNLVNCYILYYCNNTLS